MVGMKPTKTNLKQELKIQRRLELVRTRIRELTPAELSEAHGGGTEIVRQDAEPICIPFFTI